VITSLQEGLDCGSAPAISPYPSLPATLGEDVPDSDGEDQMEDDDK
jgi:hypothetical protein